MINSKKTIVWKASFEGPYVFQSDKTVQEHLAIRRKFDGPDYRSQLEDMGDGTYRIGDDTYWPPGFDLKEIAKELMEFYTELYADVVYDPELRWVWPNEMFVVDDDQTGGACVDSDEPELNSRKFNPNIPAEFEAAAMDLLDRCLRRNK